VVQVSSAEANSAAEDSKVDAAATSLMHQESEVKDSRETGRVAPEKAAGSSNLSGKVNAFLG
jgi:hypothetical protein